MGKSAQLNSDSGKRWTTLFSKVERLNIKALSKEYNLQK